MFLHGNTQSNTRCSAFKTKKAAEQFDVFHLINSDNQQADMDTWGWLSLGPCPWNHAESHLWSWQEWQLQSRWGSLGDGDRSDMSYIYLATNGRHRSASNKSPKNKHKWTQTIPKRPERHSQMFSPTSAVELYKWDGNCFIEGKKMTMHLQRRRMS